MFARSHHTARRLILGVFILFGICLIKGLALDIKIAAGTTYRECEVTKVEPDGLLIKHADGVAKIRFEDAPKAWQVKYHYDPVKVAGYRKSLEAAATAAATKLAERQKEEASMRAKAQQQEEEKRRLLEAESKRRADVDAERRKAQKAINGFNITPVILNGVSIKHNSHPKLLSEAKTKASNLNYTETRANELISAVPAGGILVVTIKRSTIGAANTHFFTVIVFDGTGKEITRSVGKESVAEVPGPDRMWWNIMIVPLPKISDGSVKIRVVDAIANKAFEFEAD